VCCFSLSFSSYFLNSFTELSSIPPFSKSLCLFVSDLIYYCILFVYFSKLSSSSSSFLYFRSALYFLFLASFFLSISYSYLLFNCYFSMLNCSNCRTFATDFSEPAMRIISKIVYFIASIRPSSSYFLYDFSISIVLIASPLCLLKCSLSNSLVFSLLIEQINYCFESMWSISFC
jgi:hypothetical protein